MSHLLWERKIHEGPFIDHDQNRELAVLKFCTCGFIDENETYFHLLKQWRNEHTTAKATVDRCICVKFMYTNTSDGMKRVTKWWHDKRNSGTKISNKHLFCLLGVEPVISEMRMS